MKLKTDATKMLTALTPVLCTLEGTKDDGGFKKVPKQLQSKFLATLKSLQEMRDGCQDAIAKRTTDPLWFNIDDVKESVKKRQLATKSDPPSGPPPNSDDPRSTLRNCEGAGLASPAFKISES